MPLFKPNDLNDLNFWLKAEEAGVSRWRDVSFNKDDAVVLASHDNGTVNRKNGVPIVTFSGADNTGTMYDTTETTEGPFDVGTGNYYYGIYFKATIPAPSDGSVRVLKAHDNATNQTEIRVNTSRQIKIQYGATIGGGSGDTLSSDALTADSYNWAGMYRSGTTAYLHLNANDNDDSGTQSGSADDSEITIGGRGAKGTSFWKSDIGEVILYHSAQTSANRGKIQGYIHHKFDSDTTGTYQYGPPTTCHCVSAQTLSTEDLSSNPSMIAELSQNLNTYDDRRMGG
tara:strand:- start:27951 stop:28805 length:855 start_codon:yes stop_codon:yes gene_type:complete